MSKLENRIRVRREDRQRLREIAKRRGMTYEDLLVEMLPNPDENPDAVIERPERDMVPISNLEQGAERVHALAGENVAAWEVLMHYLILEEHDIEL